MWNTKKILYLQILIANEKKYELNNAIWKQMLNNKISIAIKWILYQATISANHHPLLFGMITEI